MYIDIKDKKGRLLLSAFHTGGGKRDYEKALGDAVIYFHKRKKSLRNANLAGFDLSDRDLIKSDLEGVDLSYANLSDSNLSRSNLRYVNLKGANLTNANLAGSDLTGAILKSLKLSKTRFNMCRIDIKYKRMLKSKGKSANLYGVIWVGEKINWWKKWLQF